MKCQKKLFQLPDNHHYLNCSYLSPLLRLVEKAGIEGVQGKRHPWNIKPNDFFENSDIVRREFANLIHADNPQQIALMPSVSYGMAVVAKNLPPKKGGEIVVAGEQFPSNVYPWMRFCKDHNCTLKVVEPPSEINNRGGRWNHRILEAISDDTILVALGSVHWTDGTHFDLEQIGKLTHENNALFVIDGTQSVGALPFDINNIKPDALICAGYKWLMGPYGTSLGYFGERLLDGSPLEEGWIVRKNSENFGGLVDYEEEYQPGALRFDMGERSQFINLPMMAEALKQVNRWTPEAIQSYCKNLCSETIRELLENGFRIENEKWRGHHMFGVRLPNRISMEKLNDTFSEHNIHVSVRGSSVRVSPHVYNDEKDVQVFREALLSLS
ncbi:MAG: aminotransferase class V-fold PLP-dependent enzyme [Bacteroidetes bacterium]|nr:aminotransferase class V-fold PLP-dependent enzyme [Bacteroidota bacterium]